MCQYGTLAILVTDFAAAHNCFIFLKNLFSNNVCLSKKKSLYMIYADNVLWNSRSILIFKKNQIKFFLIRNETSGDYTSLLDDFQLK